VPRQIKLTTHGRRSGAQREVTLYAYEDGGRLVVVGSFGGSPRDPAWAVNLRADPSATVKRGKEETAVQATEAEGAERDRLWRLVSAEFPLYETYQRRTRRRIPIFVLDPRSEVSTAADMATAKARAR
jgi:deazaflavin-dependent oxidoreductase (nitroreductase family)